MIFSRISSALRSQKGNTLTEFATLAAVFTIAFSSPITDVRSDLEQSFVNAASAMEGEATTLVMNHPGGGTGANGENSAQGRRPGGSDPEHSWQGGGSDSTHIDPDGQCEGEEIYCRRDMETPPELPPAVGGNSDGATAENGIDESARQVEGPTYF